MVTTEQLYEIYKKQPIICTDTRAITTDCLFFALKGENFDANIFAEQALADGAAFAIVDNAEFAKNDHYLLVNDVLTALQNLAKHHRKQLDIPVIGLTGSNGKTTTKELIRAVLAEQFKTFATKGNLNNHIGVPLSILSMQSDVEIAVIEMGANHQKEIELLCEIAQPTHGLITNVGMAHLDGFGGFEGVKKGKAELFAYLKTNHGFAFINRDNPYLLEMSSKADLNKVIYYGTEKENAISGKLKHSDPLIEFEWANHSATYEAKVNLTGTYNFENILAAICIGDFFEISAEKINNGLANYFPNNNRSQLTKTENNTVICDFYNANPSSMAAALNNLKALNSAHKTAIIGDMFELGPEAAEQHLLVAKLAQQNQIDQVIFIGKNFYAFKDQFNGEFFATPAAAKEYLINNPVKNSLVLLKGSRGMALEQLLPLI
ncbi:MAG: UDP-N-acetylmuramoyl-tripeptide--D-alanyl-D-alanine ligase [Flavobacterium sp.]|nr:MAG: UDP-N-acetylmuramoyl-tripeptide--D-alanyl-D-alanine ligase [Flavobacterium sp.]